MRNFLESALALILISSFWVSCTSVKLRNANAYYEEYAFADAIKNYEDVLSRKIVPEAMERLAECYRLTGNSVKAEFWYGQVVKEKEAEPLTKYYYAESLMENGKYAEAKTWFAEYLKVMYGDERARRLLVSCDSVDLFFADSARYEVTLLPWNSNQTNNFSPAYYRSGIVFVSDRAVARSNGKRSNYTGKQYLDLYYVRQTSLGNWLEPEPVRGSINGAFNEGPAAFTHDFNTIYFTRNDYTGKTATRNKRSFNNLKILKGSFSGGEWSITADLPFNNPEYSTAHPALSHDGSSLYFISDMPWGYGGTDLYLVEFRNGKWGLPKNMGETINTTGNELFPFIHHDSVLYFASDGNYGLGGLDVFQSVRKNGKWSEPYNPGYPVNSSKDDFGLILDSLGVNGFFTSKRNGNVDKIYSLVRNPAVIVLSGRVTDKKTGKALAGAAITLTPEDQADTTVYTGQSGEYRFLLRSNKQFKVGLKKATYYYQDFTLSTDGLMRSTRFVRNAELDPIQKNESFRFYDIRFNGQTESLDASSEPVLDSLANWMKQNSGIRIEVSCHTDSRGNDRANYLLSQRRAEGVKAYFEKQGIASSRIQAVGYGESKLLNNCVNGILCLDEDHQVNIRTEMRITSAH